MGYEGILANLLALPSTLEDQQQQNLMLRSVLGPQTDASGASTPGLFTPEQLNQIYPDVGRFPGSDVPVLKHLLKGVGETGQLLQAALGQAPDAPRLDLKTFSQVQDLRSKQTRKAGMLQLLDSVPPEQQALFKQLVEGGDTKTAMKLLPGFANAAMTQTALLKDLADLDEKLAREGLTPIEERRHAERKRYFKLLTGVAGDRAREVGAASLGFADERAAISAGAADANAIRREDRAAERQDAEDADKQRRLDDFRSQNPLGAGPPAGVPTPGSGVGRISLITGGDPLAPEALGTDPLATTEERRTESPTDLSITRVTPRQRVEAKKALQESGVPPENPDGSYSEAQFVQYYNAKTGSAAQATALGGLAPGVVDARAAQTTALGRAEVLSLDEALAWGVPAGTTVQELREMQDRGEVNAPEAGGGDADSRKDLRRIRVARTALAELVGATDALTGNRALALSRLQGLGLELGRLGGDKKAAQIAAAAMIAPTLRKAFGDTGNMAVQEQQITMDAVIPNDSDTDVSARNKLLVMDELLALMESSVTGKVAGPGVREQIIQLTEAVDPTIRQKLGPAPGLGAGGDAGDGFTVEYLP